MKEDNGITLVALVITIIVLLILSGISINLVTGNNGILNQATNAKLKNEEAILKENVGYAFSTWNTDYYRSGTQISGRIYINDKIIVYADKDYEINKKIYVSDGENFYVSENESYTKLEDDGSNDENSKLAKQFYNSMHPENHIPTGFHYLEGNLEEGYVIISDDDNLSCKGEFVWVPVINENYYSRRNFEDLDIIGEILGEFPSNVVGISGSSTNVSSESEYVCNAGGFWVGRFEAGVDVDAYANSSEVNWRNASIVISKNKQPVRNITQEDSIYISNNWCTASKNEDKGTVDCQSGLITGKEWDSMCTYIGLDVCRDNSPDWGNFNRSKSIPYQEAYHSGITSPAWLYSTNWYKEMGKSIIMPTGIFETENTNSSKRNIYDIVGNVWEWSTESLADNKVSMRGGNVLTNASNAMVTSSAYEKTFSHWGVGFRIVLYVK